MSESLDIMIVDDEETICEALGAWLIKDGHSVETALSGNQALARIAGKAFDVFLLDIRMPGISGLELIPKLKARQPEADIIMITAHGSVKSAVEAMKSGAYDYLCKPFDPDELSLLMERLMVTKALREENEVLREQLIEHQEIMIEGFIAQSAAMQKVFSTIQEVAHSAAPILITGETGVGKDLVARAIHSLSRQSSGPFVAINCGALSETLLESELFGHERGAFTGAVKARRGRLEMANRGTLFLDEIGEISTKMQVALLKAIEEKKFQRVGGNQLIESDFRLLCATHRDLEAMIREDRFREDFYYRINVIAIHIPPLRERADDIPALADHFLELFDIETGKRIEGFTQRAIEILSAYPWPGNVRELKNVIERAVVIAKGRMIGAEELTFLQSHETTCEFAPVTLAQMEAMHISASLDACNWNISRAARQLGIDRSTLNRKIKRYRLIKSSSN